MNSKIKEGLANNSTKPFWRYIKSKRQDNVDVSPLKDHGKLVSDTKSKIRLLLNQFKSVFTVDDGSPMPETTKKSLPHIDPITVTTDGVAKLLRDLNASKAPGPDNIPSRVLKQCAEQIAPELCKIFQKSLDSGELPSDWRKANVTCVLKKGDKHQPGNYRPISLTSVTCKLLEHIVCRHLRCHLENNNILSKLNHSFRSGHSCETQLLTTMNDTLKPFDSGLQTDVAILDFSKAFDTVPHHKLMHKLENYGINGSIHKWISHFLMNRTMKVVLDGESSDEVSVDSGVPKGTSLSPLLFLCHINDLPDSVKSHVRLFADDCLLYRTINSFEDHLILQNDLLELETWAKNWGMRFNSKKCYILSMQQDSQFFYTLNGDILQQVEENPYLGILLSEDMKWHKHISNVTKKASSTLGFLRRNLRTCPIDCRQTAYISLVRPIMEYGATVWNPYLKKDINRLERVQHQAARFITKDYKSREKGCVTKMLNDLDIPSLETRRKEARLTMMYNVVNELLPALPPSNFLQPVEQRRKVKIPTHLKDYIADTTATDRLVYNHPRCYVVPHSKTDQYKHSFFVETVLDWNHLEKCVAGSGGVGDFQSNLNCQLG